MQTNRDTTQRTAMTIDASEIRGATQPAGRKITPLGLGKRTPGRLGGAGARGRRRVRRAIMAPAAAALTLAACTGAADAYSPPRGTPDLAKMTLQPSDLAPGAVVLVSSYFDPGSGLNLRAQYDRDFGAAATTAGVKLGQIQVSITLADSTAYAKTLFAQIPSTYGTQAGHAILALEVVPVSVNGFHPTPNNARFGKLRSAGIGQQSLLESGTITTKDATIAADFVWLRVDGVLASLAVVAAQPPLADSVAIRLARTIAAHITSVLAATH
jgi:hypothetical protein